MSKMLKALWATLRPVPEPTNAIRWLAMQREARIENFTGINGRMVHIVTVSNVTASGSTLEEAVAECRAQLTKSRRIIGHSVVLPEGRTL